MNTAVTALPCKRKKIICTFTYILSALTFGQAIQLQAEAKYKRSYTAETRSMRVLLLHSWRSCAARINRQRTESQLTYCHLSMLTPSSTSNRLKPILQGAAGKGRAQEVRGSSAWERAPSELAAKGTWAPGRGGGDLWKPPSFTLAAGRGAGSTCRGEYASCCLQAEGQHTGVMWGLWCFVQLYKPALWLNMLIRVLSLKKGTSSAPKLNLWMISLFISGGFSEVPSFWSSIKWRIMVPLGAVSGSLKISQGMLREYKPIDCRAAILNSFSQKLWK